MTDTTQNLAAASLTFSVLSFLLMVGVLVLFLFPDFTSTLKSGMSRAETSGFGASFRVVSAFLGAFSPDITLLSGFVSDIMNGSFRYSVTSFIGVLAVVLHWIVGGLVYGFSSSTPTATQVVDKAAEVATNVVKSIPGQVLGTGAVDMEKADTQASNVAKSILKKPGSVMSAISENIVNPAANLGNPEAPLQARPTRQSAMVATLKNQQMAAEGQTGPKPKGSSVMFDSASQTGRGKTGGAIPDYIQSRFNPCSIRGLGMFDISKSPMGMAALSSVFAVYLLDMFVDDKRSKKDIGVYLLFSGIVYGLNIFSYKEFQCYGDDYGAIAKSTFLPIVIGLASGAAGYSVLKTTFPGYLPLDAQNIGSPAQPGSYSQCQAPNDKDQFVCDAYKDGKRVSTTKLDM